MKLIAKVVGLLMVAVFCMGMVVQSQVEPHTGAVKVTEVVTVAPGDDLWTISARMIDKNTYGPRDMREFYQGIIQENYDEVFCDRAPAYIIHPGEKLKVVYWRKAAE